MKAERYKRIDELFEALMEMEPAARQPYLQQKCGSDEELRREVNSLLDAYEKVGDFIEAPAVEFAVESLADETNDSFIGKHLGHYKILFLLGAGGMGEVYLAQDSRLNRKVALKLLPLHFTKDANRLARFQRESRSASALNHPNIITIYEIGQEGGIHYIASEFVEGETLRQKINRGKLRVKEAVEITIQIAGALSAAHLAGIVHRDIKPENIMIRGDGYIKLLDFGLVKLTELKAPDSHNQVNLSTQSGIVLGTINYMSPEQALGQEVDARTDIFSIGVVLYEMVTGMQPFKGATAVSTFEAILNKQPPSITDSNPEASLELERIINRILEKDRDLRYQTTADLRSELKLLQRNLDSGATNSVSKPTALLPFTGAKARSLWLKTAFSISILVVLALAAWYLVSRLKPPATNWADAKVIKVTDLAGMEIFPSLSPDGKSLIYVSRASGNWDIYSKRIGAKKADNLTASSTDNDTQPAFSPDGKRIAFRSSREGGGIFIMTETGESPKKLVNFGFNPAWSPDNKELVITENSVETNNRTNIPSKMWIVNATNGESRILTDSDAVQASWSPHNKRIAYWSVRDGSQRDIWTISTNGGEPVPVTQDAFLDFNPVWSPDGRHLYFISNRNGIINLWRVAIDEASGETLAEPELVPVPSSRSRHISLSSDGKHLAFVQTNPNQNAHRFIFDPVAEKIIGQPTAATQGSNAVSYPAISPDGTLLAYAGRTVDLEIFVVKVGNTIPNQITENSNNNAIPRWSPDGKQIAVYSNQSGVYQIYAMNSDGSGRRQLTEVGGQGAVYGIWSPVDKRLAYSLFGGKTFIMDLSKPFKEQTLEETPLFQDSKDHFVAWDWSPDGKYLSGSRRGAESLERGIYIYSLETKTYERVSETGDNPVWLNDNRRLLFTSAGKLYLVDRQTKKPKELWSFSPNGISSPSITKDNRSIYLAVAMEEADVWLLTLN